MNTHTVRIPLSIPAHLTAAAQAVAKRHGVTLAVASTTFANSHGKPDSTVTGPTILSDDVAAAWLAAVEINKLPR